MKNVPIQGGRRIGAPENWDHAKDGVCHTIEVVDLDGAMVSAWLPSPEEAARIGDGEPFFLHIWCRQHPVIALNMGAIAPEEKLKYKAALARANDLIFNEAIEKAAQAAYQYLLDEMKAKTKFKSIGDCIRALKKDVT